MNKRILCWMLPLALAMLSASTMADHFTAAADPYPPYADPNHSDGGLGIEIMKAAFKTQGHTFSMEYVPWARAEAGVKNGTYDILPFTWKTSARENDLLFSVPFSSGQVKFIKLKDSPFVYNGIESLHGLTVGTILGYGYSDAFLNSALFKKESVPNLTANVKKLILHRIDLTIEDETVARANLLASFPQALSMIEFVDPPLSINSLYITVGIHNPKGRVIIEAFNKGMETIKANGTLDKLYLKYGIDPSANAPNSGFKPTP